MKKITLVLLCALLSLSLFACVAAEEDASNIDAYAAPDYTENIGTGTVTFEDGHAETAVIVGYNGLSTVHKVMVPEEISDREVSGIGDRAFYQLSTVRAISLPSTVTYIGKFAFAGCTSLETITIPASVTYIDQAAFQGCTALKSVVFEGTSLTSIGAFAFEGCTALESITLPEGLESIGRAAFGKCVSLTSLKTPSTLKSIDMQAFHACEGLNAPGALVLSAKIEEIGDFAFTGISKDYISAPENSFAASYVENMAGDDDETEDEEFDPDYMHKTEEGTLNFVAEEEGPVTINGYQGASDAHTVTVPEKIGENSVTAIGDNAFFGAATVTEVILPETITSIGANAFAGCVSLESITIPASVEFIDEAAFAGCTSLKSINFEGTAVTEISDFAFYGCSSLETVILPEALKSIGNMAFADCAAITSMNIPEGVETIGELAFYGCTGLFPTPDNSTDAE